MAKRSVDETYGSLSENSKELYEHKWSGFIKFLGAEKRPMEEDYLQYFTHLHEWKKLKASSLWATYSSLNLIHQRKYGERLQRFPEVTALLNSYNLSYTRKVKEMFNRRDIDRFLDLDLSAPYWLSCKAVVALAVAGSLNLMEIREIDVSNVRRQDDTYEVTFVRQKNQVKRQCSFIVPPFLAQHLKAYITTLKAFLGGKVSGPLIKGSPKGRFINQPMGKNLLSSVGKGIAEELGLKNPDGYTGDSFRQVAASLAVATVVVKCEIQSNFLKEHVDRFLSLEYNSPFWLTCKTVVSLAVSCYMKVPETAKIDLSHVTRKEDIYEVNLITQKGDEKQHNTFLVPPFLAIHLRIYVSTLKAFLGDGISGPLLKASPRGPFIDQPLDKGVLSNIGKSIAGALHLENPDSYMDDCFREVAALIGSPSFIVTYRD